MPSRPHPRSREDVPSEGFSPRSASLPQRQPQNPSSLPVSHPNPVAARSRQAHMPRPPCPPYPHCLHGRRTGAARPRVSLTITHPRPRLVHRLPPVAASVPYHHARAHPLRARGLPAHGRASSSRSIHALERPCACPHPPRATPKRTGSLSHPRRASRGWGSRPRASSSPYRRARLAAARQPPP